MKKSSWFWSLVGLLIVIVLLCWFWKLILGALLLIGLFFVVWKIFATRTKEKFTDEFKRKLDDELRK